MSLLAALRRRIECTRVAVIRLFYDAGDHCVGTCDDKNRLQAQKLSADATLNTLQSLRRYRRWTAPRAN